MRESSATIICVVMASVSSEQNLSPIVSGSIDSDSSYIDSGDDADIDFTTSTRFTSNLSDHARSLCESISDVLDLVELDKVMAIQAQLSGRLNNQNQQLSLKKSELVLRVERLKSLYNIHFKPQSGNTASRVKKLSKDIKSLELLVSELTHGQKLIFGLHLDGQSGVAERYPIEYNKARDKVLERQLND